MPLLGSLTFFGRMRSNPAILMILIYRLRHNDAEDEIG